MAAVRVEKNLFFQNAVRQKKQEVRTKKLKEVLLCELEKRWKKT